MNIKMQFKLILLLILFCSTEISASSTSNIFQETHNRDLKNFNAITVSSGITLYLETGNEESVRIEASERIINDVITEVKNGTLHIYLKRTNRFSFFNWRNSYTVRAFVSVKELDKLKASAGSNVRSKNNLKGNSIAIDASSGSDVILSLVYRDIEVNSGSGAKVKLEGRCKNLIADSGSGSSINTNNLESIYCKANASSGGYISLNVTDEFAGKASSGGNIRYTGDPKRKQINQSSGGTVSSR